MLDLPAEGVCDEAHAALEEIEEAMRSARGADVPPSVARKIDAIRGAIRQMIRGLVLDRNHEKQEYSPQVPRGGVKGTRQASGGQEEEISSGNVRGSRRHTGLHVPPLPQSSFEAGPASGSACRRDAFAEAKPMACRQSCSCAPCFLNKIHSRSGKVQTLPCIGVLAVASTFLDDTPSSSTSATTGEDDEQKPQKNPNVSTTEGYREGWRDIGQDLGTLFIQDGASRDKNKEASLLLQGLLHACEGFKTRLQVPEAVPDMTMDRHDAMAAVGDNATSRHAAPSESSEEGPGAGLYDGSFLNALHELENNIQNLRQWNRKYLHGTKDGVSNGVEPVVQLELVSLHRSAVLQPDDDGAGQGDGMQGEGVWPGQGQDKERQTAASDIEHSHRDHSLLQKDHETIFSATGAGHAVRAAQYQTGSHSFLLRQAGGSDEAGASQAQPWPKQLEPVKSGMAAGFENSSSHSARKAGPTQDGTRVGPPTAAGGTRLPGTKNQPYRTSDGNWIRPQKASSFARSSSVTHGAKR